MLLLLSKKYVGGEFWTIPALVWGLCKENE